MLVYYWSTQFIRPENPETKIRAFPLDNGTLRKIQASFSICWWSAIYPTQIHRDSFWREKFLTHFISSVCWKYPNNVSGQYLIKQILFTIAVAGILQAGASLQRKCYIFYALLPDANLFLLWFLIGWVIQVHKSSVLSTKRMDTG